MRLNVFPQSFLLKKLYEYLSVFHHSSRFYKNFFLHISTAVETWNYSFCVDCYLEFNYRLHFIVLQASIKTKVYQTKKPIKHPIRLRDPNAQSNTYIGYSSSPTSQPTGVTSLTSGQTIGLIIMTSFVVYRITNTIRHTVKFPSMRERGWLKHRLRKHSCCREYCQMHA